MTGLRDLLKKKDKLKHDQNEGNSPQNLLPEVTIMRSDTNTQEILNPPSFPLEGDNTIFRDKASALGNRPLHERSSSATSKSSRSSHGERKLSSVFHFRSHSRDKYGSENVPGDLPSIGGDSAVDSEDSAAQWEKRATMLAQGSANLESKSQGAAPEGSGGAREPSPSRRSIKEAQGEDDDIQEAINLHEAGDLKASTAMFGRLADPKRGNNALAQVLYGLALRHGWGVEANLPLAASYLQRAASSSSAIESQALASGMKKGGAAKGELVLAIFELGNCFRNGWGVDRDLVAARSYYETAANCGDSDAMVEAARCYEEGIGGKKNKYVAATYYRRAEEGGNKILGNSWIWKDKYNPR